MSDIREVITQRLSVLVGLKVCGVNRAADMLTVQFGRRIKVRNYRGEWREVGEWALHVQCDWKLSFAGAGNSLVSRSDFSGTDEAIIQAAHKAGDILISGGPTVVQGVSGDAAGGLLIELSRNLELVVISDNLPGNEDWRFFSHGSDDHLVIECGKVMSND